MSSVARDHLFECRLIWTGAAGGPTASYDAYRREYRIEIAGKPPLTGSAAAAFRGDPALYNPEDLLVAALSSCHCLSYLAIAARARLPVVSYEDHATGTLGPFEGRIRFREVVLRPRVRVAVGADLARARAFHEQAHAECFIANSVNFPVRNEPDVAIEGA